MKAHALFGRMSDLVDRLNGYRALLEDRRGKLGANAEAKAALEKFAGQVDELRKLVVATKEGGAITGEERIREHLDSLYGALNNWEGRPARYQLDAIDALRRELGDVTAAVDAIVGKDARALDDELKQHRLAPLQISAIERDDGLDALALHCVATSGQDCGGDERAAAASQERD